eukprot:TRINITY_DN8627_c0_g1_i1.p1 TRINITY_DN8627_c0_g1~~TRINITY_DN8627_c0_g1_i1.p1  ORF type:complete len:698 (+),score=258.70 TRINITY_DN8627_c0_g1_i1:109-2094(+)
MADMETWTEHGPTEALSTEAFCPSLFKSEKDEKAFTKLFDDIIENTKESKEESQLRERVLTWLDTLVKQWVYQEGLNKGYRHEDAKNMGGRIYTAGSYRLGVHGPGDDIDTLILVPRHVTRAEFFGSFHDRLKQAPQITELVPVPDASVPVIKCIISGLNIDLLFASLDYPTIPNEFDVLCDEVLKGVDERTQKSLNGPRVATQMLKCVPNVHNFRTVLRGIKKWARARGIYGNIYGYPGGVAWAILTARVCQLYPNFSAFGIFLKFFTFYKTWWKPDPDMMRNPNNPIHLSATLDDDKHYGFRVWNRDINAQDRKDIFPVLTPCYPYMNACYNCSVATLKIIVSEFARADTFIHDAKRAFDASRAPLEAAKFFEKVPFFTMYPTYLRITAAATDEDTGKTWAGFIESRMRRLLEQLDKSADRQFADLHVHLLPREFKEENESKPEERIVHNWFLGLEDRSANPKRDLNLKRAWQQFLAFITGHRASQFARKPGMKDPTLSCLKRKDLVAAVPFALTDQDKVDIETVLAQQRKDRKRKRKEMEGKDKAAEGPSLGDKIASLTGAPAAGMPSPLKHPPLPLGPPPPVDGKTTPRPSPAKPPMASPGAANESGEPAAKLQRLSNASYASPGKPSPSPSKGRSSGTPKKGKSLTDRLIEDAFGF